MAQFWMTVIGDAIICWHNQRAQAILLSSRGYSREVIADICGVQRDTVSDWLNRFARYRLAGLRDAPKSGRPSHLSTEAKEMIVEALQNSTPQLKPFLLDRLPKGDKSLMEDSAALLEAPGSDLPPGAPRSMPKC